MDTSDWMISDSSGSSKSSELNSFFQDLWYAARVLGIACRSVPGPCSLELQARATR